MTTEELKHEMYEQLAVIRKARKHPVMLQKFEDDLEAYLEALRVDASQSQARIGELYSEVQQWKDISTDLRAAFEKSSDACGDLGVRIDHSNRMVEVYSEAYSSQKTRTHNALCEARTLSDELLATRRELASVQNDREEGHDKLQEAIAKLARASLTIIGLHRVMKDQQAAQDRLQRVLDDAEEKINADRFAAKAEQLEWELAYGELEGRNDAKQDLIIEQREAIKTLVFELANARKASVKPSFWSFLARKKHQAKPLPKKTN